MLKKTFCLLLFLLFFIISMNPTTDSLLSIPFKIINLNGMNIRDITYLSEDKMIFSTISQPIDLYVLYNDKLSPLGIKEKIISFSNWSHDLNIKIQSIMDIFVRSDNIIIFSCGMSNSKYSGYYIYNNRNGKIDNLVNDWEKYLEFAYDLNLNDFPENKTNIVGINQKKYVYSLVQDENEFSNLSDIYQYDLKNKSKRLFYQGIINSKILLDNELVICSTDLGVLILNDKGEVLQCFSNLFFSTGAISPDKRKIVMEGGLYEHDQKSYTDEDKMIGKAKILLHGIFEFTINKKVKEEFIILSQNNVSEKKRIDDSGVIDPLKKIYIPYNLKLISKIDNLRLRENQSANGKIIRNLVKGEKLELLERGKQEIINGVTGNWVKVKTEKGEEGWAFDAYLEEVKD